MMSVRFILALVVAMLAADGAAAYARIPAARSVLARARPAAAVAMAAKKDIREEKGYWPGEWVCADCGYIYAPTERIPFEEQPRGFVCPQCAGPRRRFVKKAGDVVGSLDDSQLVIGTVIGLVAVVGLLYVGMS